MNRLPLVVLAIMMAGCYVGPDLQKFAPANSPAGTGISIRLTDKQSLEGELLTIDAAGISALVDNEIVEISSSIISWLKRSGTRTRISIRSVPISEPVLKKLRPLSRFPAGIPETALNSMLHSLNQESVRIVSVEAS